jgi:hypothetical protein
MSYCKLNHTWDEMVSDNGIQPNLLINNITNRQNIPANPRIQDFLNLDQNSTLKTLLQGKTDSEVAQFLEKYSIWKKMSRGDSTSIQYTDILKLPDDSMEDKISTMLRYGLNFRIDFAKEKDVFYSIFYVFNKTNPNQLTQESKVFLKNSIDVFNNNPSLLDEGIKKQIFELQLKDLKNGDLFDNLNYSYFVKDSDLSSKYPTEYRFFEERKRFFDKLKLDPINNRIPDRPMENIKNFRDLLKNNKNQVLKDRMNKELIRFNISNAEDLSLKEIKVLDDAYLDSDLFFEISLTKSILGKTQTPDQVTESILDSWFTLGSLTDENLAYLKSTFNITDNVDDLTLIHRIQNTLIDQIETAYLQTPPILLDESLIAIKQGDMETVLKNTDDQLLALAPILEMDPILLNSTNPSYVVSLSKREEDIFAKAKSFLSSDKSYIPRNAQQTLETNRLLDQYIDGILKGQVLLSDVVNTSFYKSLDEFEKIKLYESIGTGVAVKYQNFSLIDPLFYRSSNDIDILENLYQSSIDNIELNLQTRKNIRRSLDQLREYRKLTQQSNLTLKLNNINPPPNFQISKTIDITRIESGNQVLVSKIQSKIDEIYSKNLPILSSSKKEAFQKLKDRALFLNESNVPYRSSFENFEFLDEYSFLKNTDGSLPSNIKFSELDPNYNPQTDILITPTELQELKSTMQQLQIQYRDLKTLPTNVDQAVDQINSSFQEITSKILNHQNSYLDSLPLPSKSDQLLTTLKSLQSNTSSTIYNDLITNLTNYHRDLFRSGLNANSSFFDSFDLEQFLQTMTSQQNLTLGEIRSFQNLFLEWYDTMFGAQRLTTLDSFIFTESFRYNEFFTPVQRIEISDMINKQILNITENGNLSSFHKSLILDQLEQMKSSIMIQIQGSDVLTREALNLSMIRPDSFPFIKSLVGSDPVLKEKFMKWEIAKRVRDTDRTRFKEILTETLNIENIKQARDSVVFQLRTFAQNVPDEAFIKQIMDQEYQLLLKEELLKLIPNPDADPLLESLPIDTINRELVKINEDTSTKTFLEVIGFDSRFFDLIEDNIVDYGSTVKSFSIQKQKVNEIYQANKNSISQLNLQFQNFQIPKNVDPDPNIDEINEILSFDLPEIDWNSSEEALRQQINNLTSSLGYNPNNVVFASANKSDLQKAYRVLENHYQQLANKVDLFETQKLVANQQDFISVKGNLRTNRFVSDIDTRYLQFRLNTDVRKANIKTSIDYLSSFDLNQTWSNLSFDVPQIRFIKETLDSYVLENLDSKTIKQIITELGDLNTELKKLEQVSDDLRFFYKMEYVKVPEQIISQSWLEAKVSKTLADLQILESAVKENIYQPVVDNLRGVYNNLNVNLPSDFDAKMRGILDKVYNRPFYVNGSDVFLRADYLEAKYFSGNKVFQNRFYDANLDKITLEKELDRLISDQLKQIEDLTLLENITAYHALVASSPEILQTSEQLARQDFLKYIHLNRSDDYTTKLEEGIQKISKYQSNRILLIQGSYSSIQNNDYSNLVKKFFRYAPVTSSNYIIYQKYIDQILENALRQNKLQELVKYIEATNPKLHTLMKERSKTLLKLNLQTENVKAFQKALYGLEDKIRLRLQNASTIPQMLQVSSIYRQPNRVHYLIDKLRFGTPHYTRELLAMSGIYFNIPVSGIMMGRFGSWSTIVDVFTFLGITSPRFNQISGIIGYFDRLRLIIQGYTFKGLGNATRYLPKTVFDSFAYRFNFNSNETLINIQDWMNILSKFYNSQEISIDDWSQLIYVHYKQNQIPLVKENYFNNFIQDLEIYSPELYQSLDLSNNLVSFQNRFCQNFLEIETILSSIDPIENNEYWNQFASQNDIVLPDQLNFNVPYDLMIDQVGRFSRYDWNAYVDIEPWMRYDNFSMEKYYLGLFSRKEISQLQKILIILKSAYLSNFKDPFLNFIKSKFQIITQTDASKNYLTSSSQSTRIEKDILSLIISSQNTLSMIPLLYDIYSKQANTLSDFINAVIYYYLHTDYISQDNLDTRLLTDIKMQISSYGYSIDLSNINLTERILDHPLYLIHQFDAKPDEFLGKYNYITENVIHVDHRIITPTEPDLNEMMKMIFSPTEILDFIDLLINYQNLMYAVNLDLKEWSFKMMNDPSIPIGKKFLFLCYIQCPYLTIYVNLFGQEITNFLIYQTLSNSIYDKIYQLFIQNKIDSFGLISFLLSFSTFQNIPFDNLGKKSMFDVVMNINLDTQKYLDRLKLKIYQVHPQLFQILPADESVWNGLILKNRFFKDQYIDSDVERMIHFSELEAKQTINTQNMNTFISIFISKNIQNPIDLLLLFERYNFEDEIIEKVRKVLKDMNYLNKFFYKNWIEGQKVGEVYSIQTPVVLSKLLNLGILSEDEFFDILEIVENYSTLLNMMSYEYEFSKPIHEYPFYPKLISQGNQIQTRGFKTNQSQTSFIDKRPEDLNTLLDKVKTNIPLYTKISQYHKKIISGEKFDENELLSQIFSDISGSIQVEEKKELSDEELENLIDQKNFQAIDDYLMRLNKNKGQQVLDRIASINKSVIATQVILSMFDPTQVLVDYLFDDLVQNGIIPNEIKDRNLPMKVSSFPSFYMAYEMVYALAGRWLDRAGLTSNLVNPKDLILSKLKSEDPNFLSDLRQDYENIMNGDVEEKFNFIKTAYFQTLMYVKFIHNENPIAFNADLSISNKSKYSITMNESAKMVANKGGDGMVKLEKF